MEGGQVGQMGHKIPGRSNRRLMFNSCVKRPFCNPNRNLFNKFNHVVYVF